MNYEQGHQACQNMEKMGGSFERQMALLYYRADSTNAKRLREAFPEIFEKNLEYWLEDQEIAFPNLDDGERGDTVVIHSLKAI